METKLAAVPANRVLLIDDDPLQLRVREAVLRDAGLQVDVATSPDSALALLRTDTTKSIGAVVTDHIMPGATGDVFVRMLRELRPNIPVIVISGLAEAEDEYEGLNVRFRMKPCPPPELISLVRESLKKSS